ncbi:MAG: histidinol phosphatase [Microbacteriaceae bacterium]|nr:histidinol phosphatase [Microbacteriaceae bacterium]
MPYSPEDDLALALATAELAATVALPRFRALDLVIDTKPDRSHVTDADRAVEKAVVEFIQQHRPGDSIFGEEFGLQGESASDANRRWIIDPIDGTANFLRGVPIWGCLIALEVAGEITTGAVAAPALDRFWWAGKGLGALTRERGEERKISVSSVKDLQDASISFQSVRQWDSIDRPDVPLLLSRNTWRDRAYGDFWAYMMLAEGFVDAVTEIGLAEYDVAALVPIIEEAGGRITNLDGGRDWKEGSTLATNTHLQEALQKLLS